MHQEQGIGLDGDRAGHAAGQFLIGARIAFTCVLSPPPGDLAEALDALLLPALQP